MRAALRGGAQVLSHQSSRTYLSGGPGRPNQSPVGVRTSPPTDERRTRAGSFRRPQLAGAAPSPAPHDDGTVLSPVSPAGGLPAGGKKPRHHPPTRRPRGRRPRPPSRRSAATS